MFQCAAFVDAGYLYAQGSALLAGKKQVRQSISIDVAFMLDTLRQQAAELAPTARLLRIYWYDGLPRNQRMTSEQELVASAISTKLRL